MSRKSPRLDGQVAVVTGASRGIGRGVALQLAEAGAVVYITGRTLNNSYSETGDKTEGSLQTTVEEVQERGGRCIPVQCDHSLDTDVVKLFDKVNQEQNGQLDILVNNAFAAAKNIGNNWEVPFWEQDITSWDITNNVGLRNHYHCTVLASRMMVPNNKGLILNISSVGGLKYMFNVPYGVGKAGMDRMAQDCGFELRKHGVTMLSLWPGAAVQTENMIEVRNGKMKDNKLLCELLDNGETVEFTGRAITYLASDKNILKKSGTVNIVADLAAEYGFTDINNKRPPNLRSLSQVLTVNGNTWAAACVPNFVKIPKWMMHMSSNKF